MVPSSLFCPKCGGLNQPTAEECFACGAELWDQPTLIRGANPSTLFISTDLLKERYRLRAQIGEGGFGAVYKAQDTQLGNRPVAVKEMRPGGLSQQEIQEATAAFHREADLLAGLNHPSLPHIYEHFSEQGRWYLVMEYIEGQTLEAYQAKSANGRLSVRESFQIALQLCNVLDYLHSRVPPIIFRDLKPSNVMLTPTKQVYLIDFGIARHFKPGQSKDTMAFGSPGYAAPEQYGKAQTTPRSDVFSLGALLHHMFTGDDPSVTPFRFAALLMPRPTGTWTFLRQMVDIDERRRPASMAIVRHTLQQLADTWETDRRGGPPTTALPAYQAATGFLPAVSPGQRQPGTLPPPTFGQAATPAQPKIYPAQVKPPMPPTPVSSKIAMIVIGLVIAVALIIALAGIFGLVSSHNQSNPNYPTSPTNHTVPYALPTHSLTGLTSLEVRLTQAPERNAPALVGVATSKSSWNEPSGRSAPA